MPNDTVVSRSRIQEPIGSDAIITRRAMVELDALRSVLVRDMGHQSRNAIRNTSAGCRARRPIPSRI